MGWEGLGDGEKMEVSLWAVGQSQETGPHPLGCGRLAGAACPLPLSLSQDARRRVCLRPAAPGPAEWSCPGPWVGRAPPSSRPQPGAILEKAGQ